MEEQVISFDDYFKAHPAQIPEVFRKHTKDFAKVEIPILVPTYFPFPEVAYGPLYLYNACFTKDAYQFDIRFGSPETQPMSNWIITMFVGDEPLYEPNEPDLLKETSKELFLDLEDVTSYFNGMMFTWQNGVWDMVAIGHC